jgi:Nif-specific regulatory protein
MGEVLLAEDTLKGGTRVAIKTLRSDAADLERYVDRLKAEFDSLCRLTHPNLAKVHDFGYDRMRQQYFFTVEYVEGNSLLEASSSLSTSQLYEIVAQICRGLEYIHSHGLIHYDVKPQHILITGREPEYAVRIIDFGLAAEVQTKSGIPIRGTPAYLAPEIVKEEVIDHRADLYSLGATLYHVVCGKPPFEGENILSLLRQHVEQAPKFPRSVAKKLPPALKHIIMKLLSKGPSERYQSANEVIEAINELAGIELEVETSETRMSYILSPRLVGREDEVERLKDTFEQFKAGELRRFPILVVGEDGAGKSRLMREFKYHIQLSNVPCFAAEATTSGSLSVFAKVMQQAVSFFGARSAAVRKYAPYLAKLMPELKGRNEIEDIAILGVREGKMRFYHKLVQFMLSASGERQYTVLIDDSDKADNFSKEFLEYLVRACSLSLDREIPIGLFLCTSCKPGSELLTKLLGSGYAEDIRVGDLDEAQVGALVNSMIALGQQEEALTRKIFSVTGGRPLFVEELMKGLIEENAIVRRGVGWQVDIEKVVVPETLSSAIKRRLSRISRQELLLLRTMAALGRPVPNSLLSRITGTTHLSTTLLNLRKRQLIVRRHSGYTFSQTCLGQILLNRMQSRSLKALHDKIGAALEEFHKDNVNKYLEEIAYHYLRGSDKEKAYSFGLQAIEESAKLYTNDSVIDYCQRLLSFLGKDESERRFAVSTKLGETLELVGKYEKARKLYTRLFRLKGLDHLQKAESRRRVGNAYLHVSQYDKALKCCNEALILLSGRKSPITTLADTYNLIGVIKQRQKDFTGAEEALQKSLRTRRAVGDALEVADSLNNLGLVYTRKGDRAKAEKCYEESLHIYESRSDKGRIGTSHLNLGIFFESEGRYVAAAKQFSKSLAIQEKIGDRWRAAISKLNLGGAQIPLGEYELAFSSLQESLAEFREMGSAYGSLHCEVSIAQGYLEVGELDKAFNCFEKIVEREGEQLPIPVEVQAKLGLGATSLQLGRYDDAENCLNASLRRAQEVGDNRSCLEVKLQLGEMHLKTGFIEKCRVMSEETLGKAKQIEAWDIQGWACLLLGKYAASRNLLKEAKKHFEHTLSIARKLRLPDLIQQALRELAEVYRQSGNEHRARRFWEQARKSIERIARNLGDGLRTAYLSAPSRQRIIEGGKQTEHLPEKEGLTLPSDRSTRLLSVAKEINSELDLDKLLELIVDTAIGLFGAQRGFLVLADGGNLKFEVSRSTGKKTIEKPADEISNSVIKKVMDRGKPLLSTNAQEDKSLRGAKSIVDLKLRSILCIPFKVKGKILGCIYLDNPYEEKVFGEKDLGQLEYLADQAAVAIENARLYREAIVDPLTDTYTHRFFDTRLREEIRRARRYRREVSMLMIDVDRFKLVNDTYGHEVGSEVLKGVAKIIHENTRKMIDMMKRLPSRQNGALVGRYGGDEFEILLPETGLQGAQAAALRVMEKVRESIFADNKGKKRIRVTVSIGIAVFPDDAGDEQSLVIRADEALYNAKRTGRNRAFTFKGKDVEEDLVTKREILAEAGIGPELLTRDGVALLGMVNRILDTGLDPDKMLQIALGTLLDVTKAERGFIILVDEQGRLSHRAARNIDDKEINSPDFSRNIVQDVLKSGRSRLIEDALGQEKLRRFQSVVDLKLRSVLCVPVKEGGETLGTVYLDNSSLAKQFTEEDKVLVEAFAQKIAIPLKLSVEHEKQAIKIQQLQGELQTRYQYENIVGASKAMQGIFKVLDKVIPTDLNVLVCGETGTGKELVAKAVHYNGPRKEEPFISVNCAAIPESLLESELFGYVKGAFTGANEDKRGLFESANGGTLFLDEISNMSESMQRKLLRVLQERELRPIGTDESTKVDVRIVSATNRNLKEMVEKGEFREDLYYRLRVVEISLPPLRERREDIPLLTEHFLTQAAGQPEDEKVLSPAALDKFLGYDWPGNVRELENVMRNLVLGSSRKIKASQVETILGKKIVPPLSAGWLEEGFPPLSEMERQHILRALDVAHGNKSEAARLLGIGRETLRRRLKDLLEK